MIAFAVIFGFLGVIGTIITLVALRIWIPTLKMSSVVWPLRLPTWTAWIGIPMTLIGLIVWTIGLATRAKGVARFGGWMAVAGGSGFLSGWIGGVIGTYGLQFFTGWPPPSAEKV